MPLFQSSGGITSGQTPTIQNISLVADTPASVTMPTGTTRFFVKSRTPATLWLSYVSGFPTYITIHPGAGYSEPASDGVTGFFIQSNSDTVLEIISWA